jgi:Kef-type K+ transport system membrane component KefB
MDIFFEIGMLVIFAGIGTYIAKLFKQPLIPAYIISGIVMGRFLGIVTNQELITKLSEIGIAFLLFMVGLELELKKLKDIGLASTVAGAVQMALVFLAGYFGMKLLGMGRMESVYLGLVIAFSSTMLVVKMLSDKLEINTLHGRLVIGILVIQDIVAIVALSYLTSLSNSALGYAFLAKLVGIAVLGIVLSKFVFPHVFEFAARSRELLLTTSLSVCFLFALLFSVIGLSMTIGAFFAGVLLANLPYRLDIVGRVKPLRDFFAILFFTSLGLQLNLGGMGSMMLALVVLLVMVVLLKPLVTYLALIALGHKSRTSFITSVSLAQVSEFSLVLVITGVGAGVLSGSILTVTIMLAVLTMAYTAYFMNYEAIFYHKFVSIMKRLGIKASLQSSAAVEKMPCDVLLCGYDRIGYSILNSVLAKKKNVVVVDFNPDVIKKLNSMSVPCVYGDVCDPEVLQYIDVRNARMVISTANSYEDNLLLLNKIKSISSYIPTIVTAHKIDEALELYRRGADYVILPHFLGGDMVAGILSDFESSQLRMMMHKYRHINDLLERKGAGHEHPTHAEL